MSSKMSCPPFSATDFMNILTLILKKKKNQGWEILRGVEHQRTFLKTIFYINYLHVLPTTCVINIWLLLNSFFPPKTTELGETEIKLTGDITGWYFWQASSNIRVSGEQPVHPWVSSASISDHTAALKISVLT